MPWVRLKDPIKTLNVEFLPLLEAYSRIPDQIDVVRHVDAVVTEYHLSPLQADRDCVICTISHSPFTSQNADKFDEIALAARVLAVGAIAANEYLSYDNYVNSNTFGPVAQRFLVGDYHTAFMSRRRDGSTNDTGYGYEHLRTTAPPWVRQCRSFKLNEELLSAFDLLRQQDPREFRRFSLAIEWFLKSFSDDPADSLEIEISALSTAFDQTHQSNMNAKMMSTIFSDFGHDAVAIVDWYRKFIKHRNTIVHGSMKGRPTPNVMTMDLLLGSELLIGVWKKLFAQKRIYTFTKDDEDRIDRVLNVMETNSLDAWKDMIKVRKRRGIREVDKTTETPPIQQGTQGTPNTPSPLKIQSRRGDARLTAFSAAIPYICLV